MHFPTSFSSLDSWLGPDRPSNPAEIFLNVKDKFRSYTCESHANMELSNIPGTILNTWLELTLSILPSQQDWERRYYNDPHLIDEETEAQRD
jgi:hypothetical protein